MFNSEKWRPVFAPDVEGSAGSDSPDVGSDVSTPDVGGSEPSHSEGPGSGRSALRRSLEDGFKKAREPEEPAEAPEQRSVNRKPPRQKAGDRVGGRLATMPDSGTEPTEPAAAPATEGDLDVPSSNPPDGWSEEAKQAWNEAHPAIQAAALKRESDMARGVETLRQRYAEVDKALEPHMEAIRAHGHTPGQAINQLFAWFDALSKNPQSAFPALAGSFGYDLRQFIPQQQRPQQQPQQPAANAGTNPANPAANGQAPNQQPQQPRIPTPQQLQQYINQQVQQLVQQQTQPLYQTFQEQQQTKTEENLALWANGKPYYEEVREDMARLIGNGAIPLKNGKVDLDGAYDQAIWGRQDIRNRILQEQSAAARKAAEDKKKAETKAQTEAAQAAARKAGGLPIQAPGLPPVPQKGKRVSKSVKETLLDAWEQHKQ